MPIGSRYTDRGWQIADAYRFDDAGPIDPVAAERRRREEARRRQQEAVARAEEQRRDERRRRDQDVRSAAQRARRLLEDVLSPEQKAELAERGHFHVIGSRGNRYRIKSNGVNGNVEWVDESGQVLGRLCAHLSGVPDADSWLAQMLCLQNDEETFLRTANVHSGRRPELVAA